MDPNPYVGPRAFDTDESGYFFGRDEETEILQGLVMSRRVVLLFAKSGVGKSSLVRAGLIPRLTATRTAGRGHRARQLPPKMKALPIATVGGALPAQISPKNVHSFIALYSLRPYADPKALAGQTLADGLTNLIGNNEDSPQDNIPACCLTWIRRRLSPSSSATPSAKRRPASAAGCVTAFRAAALSKRSTR